MATKKNLFDLSGHTALVTGGGYGLGRGLVHGLAAHGATVIGLARSEAALQETFSSLGAPHRYIVGDLTNDALYEQLDEISEHVDIVVNNAGGDPHSKNWDKQSTQDWRETYEINVIATERLCQLFIPKMAAKGWGRIINIASVYGIIGQNPKNTGINAGAGAYTAAKHGLIGLTNYLACQIGRTGVTINSLSPGMITWMETPDGEPELWKQLAAQTPVGRNSQPEDYVTATVFLASEGSSFVHGTNLVVDGGWSVW